MAHSFRTKWKSNKITCICTLDKECKESKFCEELEFKIIKKWSPQEIMSHASYRRKNGSIRQVRNK